jgi:signal transduction histidine kinase
MIVQSEAGASVANGTGAGVADRFDAIATTGREALAELRRLLGALRDPDDRDELAPQPGIDRLDALVEAMTGAGLSVVLHVEGPVRPLPAGVELSGYRIVQEALTNSLRHAGPVHVAVRLCYSEDALELEIADDGPGRRDGPPGWGLVGIRERVAMFGGSVTVGERAGGGFVVGATLPLHAR